MMKDEHDMTFAPKKVKNKADLQEAVESQEEVTVEL